MITPEEVIFLHQPVIDPTELGRDFPESLRIEDTFFHAITFPGSCRATVGANIQRLVDLCNPRRNKLGRHVAKGLLLLVGLNHQLACLWHPHCRPLGRWRHARVRLKVDSQDFRLLHTVRVFLPLPLPVVKGRHCHVGVFRVGMMHRLGVVAEGLLSEAFRVAALERSLQGRRIKPNCCCIASLMVVSVKRSALSQ